MNILYFDENEMWFPSLNDMMEEIDTTETHSVSLQQKMQGKQMTLYIAPFEHPYDKLCFHIGEE